MLLSEYIGVEHKDFQQRGILDTFIELDANYYINLYALKNTKVIEFKNSYQKIKTHFANVYKLLNSYIKTNNMAFYKSALKMFNYPEVNELGIGLSQGNYGKGLTSLPIRKGILDVAVDLIKEGNSDSEMFLLIGLLTEGIGVDYISDMISNIIIEDIKEYTKNINMGMFGSPDYKYNRFKKCSCYYIPLDIVDEIPFPKFMYDIDTAVRVNSEIRQYMNNEIGDSFMQASKEEKSNVFVNYLKNKNNYDEITKLMNKYEYEPYDFTKDDVGIVKLIDTYLNIKKINFEKSKLNAKYLSMTIINEFKSLIENTGIIEPFLGKSGKVKEKNCQNMFYIYAKKQFELFNYDLNPECNQGRGPADFKISLGQDDKCIIEVKLLSNKQYLHGIDTQIIEYAKSENCNKLIYYVFDDMEDRDKASERLQQIEQIALQKRNQSYDLNVTVVRVERKLSASIF